jgi:hypothetical protein
MTSALVAAKATLIPSPSLHPPRAGKLKHSAVCNTQCRSTGVSPRELAQFPTGVKEVGSSSLLVNQERVIVTSSTEHGGDACDQVSVWV